MDKFSIDSNYIPHGQMGVQTITREEYEASPSMGEQFISISNFEGNPHVFQDRQEGETKMYFDGLRARNRQQQVQTTPVQVPTPTVDTTSFQCEVITNQIESLKATNRELLKHGEKYIQDAFDNADKIEELKKELAALKGEVYKSRSMFISLTGEAKEEVVEEKPQPVQQVQQQPVQANVANPQNFTPEELAFINQNAEAFNQLTNQMLQMQAQGQHVPSLGEMMGQPQHHHHHDCGCGHDHHQHVHQQQPQPVQQPMPQQAPQPQGRMSWADMAQMVNEGIAYKEMQERGINPNVHFDFQDAVPLYKIYEAQAQQQAMMMQQLQYQQPQPQPAVSQNMAMGNAPRFDFETAVPLDYGFNGQPSMNGMASFIPPTAAMYQPDHNGWHKPNNWRSKIEEVAKRRGVTVESLMEPTEMTWQEAARAEAIASTPVLINRLQRLAHEKGYNDIQTLINSGEVDFDAMLDQVAQEMTDIVYKDIKENPIPKTDSLVDKMSDVYDAKKWLGFANRPEEIENDIHIRNAYINRLNDMICGVPHNVPWKPENTYEDVL